MKHEITKRTGFTLIELMVAVMVSMLLVGGLALSLSNYYNIEKINQTTAELISLLSMSRNLAATNQTTAGFTGDLGYVSVTVNSTGVVQAFPNGILGVGESYFSKNTGADERVSTVMSGELRFAAGTGKLVDNSGSPLPSNTTVRIVVSSLNVGSTKQIVVNSLGTIK